MITIGPPEGGKVDFDEKIPRIKKTDISKPVCSQEDDDEEARPLVPPEGPTPPPMPIPDLPKEFLDRQDACFQLAQDLDFEFLSANN